MEEAEESIERLKCQEIIWDKRKHGKGVESDWGGSKNFPLRSDA
jgi:hypothetical protein